jgi:hypothetical protein
MSNDHGDEIKAIDGAFGLSAKNGIALSSENGSLSFMGAGKDSSIILDTKNFALLKAGENCLALYDNGDRGGLVNIQGHQIGALNLSFQEEDKRNAALTIINGETHLGVFTTKQFDRVHIKEGELTLQSSKGPINNSTDLSSLTIKQESIEINSQKSVLTINGEGFNLKNAAGTFELKMNENEFSVTGNGGYLFKIDLVSNKIEINGVKVFVKADQQLELQVIENKIAMNPMEIKMEVASVKEQIEMLKSEQSTLSKKLDDAISQMNAGIQQHDS